MSDEINKEELLDGVEFTPDTNDLPSIEEAVEVKEAPKPKKTSRRKKKQEPVEEELPAPAPVSAVVEPKATKASAAVTKNEEGRTPGMYHKGRKISAVPARLGNKWTVIINGKRHKVLKKEIEIVK